MTGPEPQEISVAMCGMRDEGLDQDFNSLDAQREAAEAFVQSQRGEGWAVLPERYDDGGRGFTRLRAALAELAPHPPSQLPTARKVGYALRRFRGRVVGGRRLQTRVYAGNRLWFVETVGGGGSVPPTPARPPAEVTDLLQLA